MKEGIRMSKILIMLIIVLVFIGAIFFLLLKKMKFYKTEVLDDVQEQKEHICEKNLETLISKKDALELMRLFKVINKIVND